MLWLITYWKQALALLVAAACFSLGWKINGDRWEVKHQALIQEYQEATLKAERSARSKEQELQTTIDNERVANETKVRAINTQLNNALNELRNRPTRESVVHSKGSSDCKGASGRELFREDAGFLIREASRADRLAAALVSCYASYDAVRDQLNND